MSTKKPLTVVAPSLDSGQQPFTCPETCAILGIRATKLQDLVNKGALKRVRMSHRCSRITRASIVDFLAKLEFADGRVYPLERLGAAAVAKTAAEPAAVKRGPGRPRKVAAAVEQAAAQ